MSRTSRVSALPRIVMSSVVAMLSLVAVLTVTARAADDADKDKPGKGPAELKGLKYRLVGPAVGGRVARVAGVPGNPLVYYAATASGGVWKSEDGGLDWKPIFDDQPISSIGSIAVAPSDPNTIYVGSGEANIRGNVADGNGIYKSTDAGKTWTHVWKQVGQIGTMAVHPRNADIAFAAVLGHAFGPNPERGVYRTKDGGRTWQQVLKKDADTGASDVCINPSNPNILFAGLWQARRTAWSMTSAGPGAGLYVSRDGGDTWKQIKEHGIPEGPLGKIGCGVAPSDGNRVYALIEAEKGGLFRSDDGGESWDRVSEHHALRQRPWYYSTLTIDPTNPNIVWFPQVPLLRTIDGGKTIQRIRGAHHGDHHDVWIDPTNPKRMINGNDGGVDLSWNGGESWYAPPIPIAQFYHVAVDNATPYHVSGAMQDLGTAWGPSDSLADGGIRNGDWFDVGGGEAGHTASDPNDPNIVYAGEYMGIITRYDHRTGMARHVGIYPENGSGHGAEDLKYRFQWTAPIVVSPHDGNVVYHGGNVLFRTTDGGQNWTAISPDLTRNDKTKQKWSGGPVTGDNTGVEWYDTIFAIAESPKEKGVLWVGSDDGLVHVSRDAGAHWTRVTPGGAPEWGTVDLIEASPHDAGTAYVVFDGHRLDDTRPYLYKTTDYGKSWKSLAGGLPKDVYLHAVREDPAKKGMLYLGTERGVSFSRDDGATWQVLGLNFPTVAVHDLRVKDDDLVVGTHGRSIWIFDDLSVIRDWTKEIGDQPVHLFPVRPAVRWEERSGFHEDGPGENPARGAVIAYSLKGKVEGDIRLDILDANDKVIRTITSKKDEDELAQDDPDGGSRKKAILTKEPGVQRVVWNLRTDGAVKIRKAKSEGNPEGAIQVPPGRYTARLTVGKTIQSQPVEVKPDPRLGLTPADLEAQSKFVGEIQGQVSRLATIVNQIQSVRDQLNVKIAALKGNDKAAAWVKEAQGIIGQCDAMEAKLHNPKAEVEYDILAKGAMLYSRLTTLLQYTLSGSGAPTQGQREVFDIQRGELDKLDAEWRALLNEQVMEVARKAETLFPGGLAVPGR
jgi:photosystem II stability/assembly factor-like uncharacterized protein